MYAAQVQAFQLQLGIGPPPAKSGAPGSPHGRKPGARQSPACSAARTTHALQQVCAMPTPDPGLVGHS